MFQEPPVPRKVLRALGVIVPCLAIGCESSSDATLQPLDDQEPPTIRNDGPEGNSGLEINDTTHPLNVALGDIRGVENEHFRIDFTLANGTFRLASETIDGQAFQTLVPAESSAVFHMHMFNPGSSFDYGSYAYAADVADSRQFQGTGYFTAAYIGIDTDQDRQVSPDENTAVIDGTVEFTGTLPDVELSFSLTLENGASVTGTYKGLFDFTER